jgi:hypothetical protein
MEVAKTFTGSSLVGLAQAVEAAQYAAFSSRRYEAQSGEHHVVQSTGAIRRAISLALQLEIIDSSGQPTRSVRSVSGASRLPSIVGKRAWSTLEAAGCSREALSDACKLLLADVPARGPTSQSLWEALDLSCSRSTWSGILSLLRSCDEVGTFQRRLYYVETLHPVSRPGMRPLR